MNTLGKFVKGVVSGVQAVARRGKEVDGFLAATHSEKKALLRDQQPATVELPMSKGDYSLTLISQPTDFSYYDDTTTPRVIVKQSARFQRETLDRQLTLDETKGVPQ